MASSSSSSAAAAAVPPAPAVASQPPAPTSPSDPAPAPASSSSSPVPAAAAGAGGGAGGWTLFQKALAAIERTDFRLMNELVQVHGEAFINQPLPDNSGYLLHYAARKVKTKSVVWLLEHGAEVNCIDAQGETPLCWCATISSFSSRTSHLLQLLVNAGADVDWQDFGGWVPLTHAVVRGSVDATRRMRIDALLKLGAEPRIRDFDGMCPLDHLGKNSNDGCTWTDALPENKRELDRCRALLRGEMWRREVRVCLWVVRKKIREERERGDRGGKEVEGGKGEEAAGGGGEKGREEEGASDKKVARVEHAEAKTCGDEEEEEEEGEEMEKVEVAQRLMALEDDIMFMKCMNFI